MHVLVIGLGLIGGSIARDLRRTRFAMRLSGADSSPAHAAAARRLGLVDAVAPWREVIGTADLVILAVPVDAIVRLLPELLAHLAPDAVLLDVGSVKAPVVAAARGAPRRARFVATHPMAGTECAGPEAAVDGLFAGALALLCDCEESDAAAVTTVERLYAALGARTLRLDAATHDRHAALLSHAPHVVAFSLALAALEQTAGDPNAFSLAGGGFASITRVARSSPAMWTPILRQNRANVLAALALVEGQLAGFRAALEADDAQEIDRLIARANAIPARQRPG